VLSPPDNEGCPDTMTVPDTQTARTGWLLPTRHAAVSTHGNRNSTAIGYVVQPALEHIRWHYCQIMMDCDAQTSEDICTYENVAAKANDSLSLRMTRLAPHVQPTAKVPSKTFTKANRTCTDITSTGHPKSQFSRQATCLLQLCQDANPKEALQ